MAGTLAGGAVFGYASHGVERQPRPESTPGRAHEVIAAYESVRSVDDMFKTRVVDSNVGAPAYHEDYPGYKVPSLELDITSQMTDLAKRHEAVLPDNEPELEWRHRIAALNTFYTREGKVAFEQPSWPRVEDGRGANMDKEEAILADKTNDGRFRVIIPLGQPGVRDMAIVERLGLLPNGVADPKGNGYPMKELTRVVDTLRLRVGEDGSVKIENPTEG